MDNVLPYAVGNVHPRFMGWVHGGGTVVGMLAEMLAAGLNANLAGRDQMPLEVERQIVLWMRDLFGLPHPGTGTRSESGDNAAHHAVETAEQTSPDASSNVHLLRRGGGA